MTRWHFVCGYQAKVLGMGIKSTISSMESCNEEDCSLIALKKKDKQQWEKSITEKSNIWFIRNME